MAPRSIVEASGQVWKLYAAGIGAPALTLVSMLIDEPNASAIVGLMAIPLAAGLFFWLSGSTRCPRCSARWIWLAAERAGARGFGAFLRADACPDCGMSAGEMANARPRAIQVSRPRYLGEQDGPIEEQLKAQLVELIRRGVGVEAAYLARVAYGNESTGVALCIRSTRREQVALVKDVGSIFASMFGRHEHLDFVFLTGAQEGELAAVCRPFFRSDARGACSPRTSG